MSVSDFNVVFAGKLIRFYWSVFTESLLLILVIMFALGFSFFITQII